MEYKVTVTPQAIKDLHNIGRYIAIYDNLMSANYVMSEIEKTYLKLNIFPHRGSHPKELNERKTNFRQIFFKSYRIVYRIDEENSSVSIVLIADGRQNMQKLMADKLPK